MKVLESSLDNRIIQYYVEAVIEKIYKIDYYRTEELSKDALIITNTDCSVIDINITIEKAK